MRIGLACEAGAPPAEMLDLLEAAGLPAASLRRESPPAVVATGGATWFLGPSGDVLRACDRGALDAGVIGSDRLLEDRLGVADLLDLRRCRDDLVFAVAPAAVRPDWRLRVATRHPGTARRHFRESGVQPDIFVLDEPMLAPALGLADGVIELSARLRAGRPGAPVLETRDVVASCSAHLVASRAARVLLRAEFAALVERLRGRLGGVMRQLPWNDDVAATVAELRALAPPVAEVRAAVAAIVDDVRARGDAAVRDQTARLDRVELEDDYVVPVEEMRSRLAALSPELRAALEVAAANIRSYHAREAVAPWRETLVQGQVVGQEVVPLAAAGLYVPGGLADYPSSVLMTVIPAQVAGVERIVVCSPPRPGGGAAAGVAAACALLGVERLYPIGGAQAVAAMALGTACVPRCDVIVGPGNAYVTEAKRMLVGEVGIDSLAGPSEVLIIADASGEPEWLAADLVAQAEHGSGAMACLADVGGRLAAPVAEAVGRLSAELGIATGSVVIVACPDREAALALSNAFAPEHLELHCEDARGLLPGVRNAGAVFVGPHAATAFADYAAGTNHVLPTGGSARFGQGLSVRCFPQTRGCGRTRRFRRGGARAASGGHRRRGGPARSRALRPPPRPVRSCP